MKVCREWDNNHVAVPLPHAIQNHLHSSNHGIAEAANETANNVATALSNLIDILHEKNALTDEQALYFAGYGWVRVS